MTTSHVKLSTDPAPASANTVLQATGWHKTFGQHVLITLVLLLTCFVGVGWVYQQGV